MKTYYVYILASKCRGTLYVGVTNDLIRRVKQHKEGTGSEFTKEYGITRLVHYEHTSDIEAALNQEKRLKKWKRSWKIELIEKTNPEWKDLFNDFVDPGSSPG